MMEPNEERLDHMEQENNVLLEELKKAVGQLKPFFDSVIIFCNKYESPEIGTTNLAYGEGNDYAQYGQVVQWVNMQNKAGLIIMRATDEDDDDE